MLTIRQTLKYVEIETCNQCTRQCKWCLFGRKPHERESFTLLDDEIIYQVYRELKSIEFSGTIALYSINEPLLDKRICSGLLIHKAREILGNKVCITLTTNGDLLTTGIVQNMFNAGLDSLNISCYDNDSLSKAKALSKIESRIKILNQIRYTNGDWESNRAGFLGKSINKKYSTCIMPYFRVVVGWNGLLRICPHEMIGTFPLGDLNKKSFIEILESKEFELIRKKLMMDRQNVPNCKNCNIEGSLNYILTHINRACEVKSILKVLKEEGSI